MNPSDRLDADDVDGRSDRWSRSATRRWCATGPTCPVRGAPTISTCGPSSARSSSTGPVFARPDGDAQPATLAAGSPTFGDAAGVEPVGIDQARPARPPVAATAFADGCAVWSSSGLSLRAAATATSCSSTNGTTSVIGRTADRIVDLGGTVGLDANHGRAHRRHVVGSIGDRDESNRQLGLGKQSAQHRRPASPQRGIVDDRQGQPARCDRPAERLDDWPRPSSACVGR